jgi:hypothetical protein
MTTPDRLIEERVMRVRSMVFVAIRAKLIYRDKEQPNYGEAK